MEWAYELINGYKAGDARAPRRSSSRAATSSCRSSTPTASTPRAAPPTAPDERRATRTRQDDIVYLVDEPERVPAQELPLRRRLRGRHLRAAAAPASPRRASTRTATTAALWGGPGAEGGDTTDQTYRGPGPFSEPETRNIQWLVSRNQVMTLITNHTTAGLVLRAPGLAVARRPGRREPRLQGARRRRWRSHNGYFSQKGFELYDTTGTTEDWSYNVTGGFGFTFEIYCGEPELRDRRLRRPGVPPALRDDGQGVGRHEPAVQPHDRPRQERANPFGMAETSTARATARRTTSPPRARSTRRATASSRARAPAGATLRLNKAFKTETFPQPQDDGTFKPIEFDDKLETTLRRSARRPRSAGTSTRRRGRSSPRRAGARRRAAERSRSEIAPTRSPTLANCAGVLVPAAARATRTSRSTCPSGAGIDNARGDHPPRRGTSEASDYDVEVYRRTAPATSTGEPVAASQLRGTDFEQVTFPTRPASTCCASSTRADARRRPSRTTARVDVQRPASRRGRARSRATR